MPFPVDVRSGRGREADPTLLQRERNSFKTSAALTRRPAATSASDSARAACKALRSASVSQSPGSSGSNSTSVPSGRVVGSSTTRRPACTRALIVIRGSVALDRLPNNRVEPMAARFCGRILAFGRRGSPRHRWADMSLARSGRNNLHDVA